jgi:hypothetical protein
MNGKVEKVAKVSAKGSGIIVLTKTQLAYFAEGMPKMISYTLPQEVARDMDIVNKDLLATQLKNFITQHKLQPANLSILLANDILFARESKATTPEQKKSERDAFVDLVPFEYPSVKVITFSNKTFITVANKDYYDPILNNFTDAGFTTKYVLPLYVFAKDIDLKRGVTSNSALQLIKRIDTYKEYNFNEITIVDDPQAPQEEKKLQLQVKGGKTNRTFVLVGVFVMLLGVLLAVYLWSQQNTSSTQPQKTSQTNTKAMKVAKATTPTPAVLGATNTSILLQHTAGDQEKVTDILSMLRKSGFSNAKSEFSDYYNYSTTVTFASTVSDEVRNFLVDELTSMYPDLFVQEVATATADVTILLTPATFSLPTNTPFPTP